jgi:hypothetical protein
MTINRSVLVAAGLAAATALTLSGCSTTKEAVDSATSAASSAGSAASSAASSAVSSATSAMTSAMAAPGADPKAVIGDHTTVEGGSLTVTGTGDAIKVNDAGVVCGGIKTANATLYLIDTVLMPPAAPAEPTTAAPTTTTTP